MSDKYGNPDRFLTVERIEEWMDELEKAGRVGKMFYPPNGVEPTFSKSEIKKLIFEDAQEF